MLKLKSEQDGRKHSIEQIRNKLKKRIREEEHHYAFAASRKKLIEEANNQCVPAANIKNNGPSPIQQPLPPNYFEYMAYAMRMIPAQNYPIYHHHVANAPSIYPPFMPQMEQNIYFQKNGFIIYRTLLGSGTFAQVWEGRIKATGQKIAAKQVQNLEQNQRRCLRELQSEYVVKVIDIFKHLSKSFIILEYCDKNLRQELKSCDYKIEMALKYFEQLVYGMDVLQSKNIIHRDLKFENILVKDNTIKIADFGLAKCLGTQLQIYSCRRGTPYTMAPEIYFSPQKITTYTNKSDIWSIGVILHEMLYKVHPFLGELHNFRNQKRVRVNRRYGILDKIIDECLVFNPNFRINWAEFKTLFNFYLEQKHYYYCPKEKPLVSKLPINNTRVRNCQTNLQIEANLIKYEVRAKEGRKSKLRERQQSRDCRADRTPHRRKKFSCEKDFIEKDKFENANIKQKGHINDSKLNAAKRIQKGERVQKKAFQKEKEKNVVIDFREIEQRPLRNENKPISKEKFLKQAQKESSLRLLFEGLAILIVIFTALYICLE